MAEEALDVGTEEAGSGNKKKLIIIVVAIVLLLGIGGGAAFFLLSGSDEASAADESQVENSALEEGASADGPAIYLDLDPAFVVDFMVSNKQRYLQLDLTVKSRNQEQVDALKIHMPLIRNSLVLLFASQDFEKLQSLDGKLSLKLASVEAINGILMQETGKGGVEDVLFTNFVMQ